jgi:hypothetical protein
MTTKYERAFFTAAVATGIAALFCAGCGATGLAERARTADVRLSIPMQADSPRMLVVGPARLLHVDVEGRGVVSLYSVQTVTGLEGDCAGTPLPAAMTLVPDDTNQLNLDVPAGQAVCMAPIKPEDRRLGAVHLHARRTSGEPFGTLQARND